MSLGLPLTLEKFYSKLYKEFGPQYWWPGRGKFEIIVGAILTQNTNWGNVEKALSNLKTHRLLTPQGLNEIPLSKLAVLIKPSGFFNVKAKRLKSFIHFLFDKYQGSLRKMSKEPLEHLRRELLNVKGIGEETADSILLYAFGKPIFVVDAYTKRFLYRHGLIDRDSSYKEVQELFMNNVAPNIQLFNEYHALIVRLGKNFCRPTPLCEKCPLNKLHYSLKSRCALCHRVLLDEKDKKKKVFICKRCTVIDDKINI